MTNSSNNKKIHIGILGAMPEEIGVAIKDLDKVVKSEYGDLMIYSGQWKGYSELNQKTIYLSIAWSGWGKVSSSRASTRLISKIYKNKKIDLIIFTGVAGAIESTLNQWDVILPNKLIQHDMDATPIFNKYVIPALQKKYIEPKKELHNEIFRTLQNVKKIKKSWPFKKILKGTIATGDKFISDQNSLNNLRKSIQGVLAVEMEGAAVAQVGEQENVPWIIIRVISDGADENASENFQKFISSYKKYSWNLVTEILKSLPNDLIVSLKN